MKAYDRKKPLISIHIPKCAGVSYSEVLKTWFKGNFYRHYHNEKRNRPPRKHRLYRGFFSRELRPDMCIHGHFNNSRGNGVHDYYPEVDQFITMLRHPFNLHVSTYFYVRREAQRNGVNSYRAGKRHPIIENDWNIIDYLGENTKSYMCRFLPPDISLDNYRQVLDDSFVYIGITERLQQSVDILAGKLGYPSMQVRHINVSDWNEPIPDGARELFAENNPLEMAIYDYASNNWGNRP